MNHQAKIVSNDAIVVFFSLSELAKQLPLSIGTLTSLFKNLRNNANSNLAYVSVLGREETVTRNGQENFYPDLERTIFTLVPSSLMPDLSGTVYSVKLTLLNRHTPYQHLEDYVRGLKEGEYQFFPRITVDGKYLYPTELGDQERAEPTGAINVIGFDLLYSPAPTNVINCEDPEPKDTLAEKLAECFGFETVPDISKYQSKPFSVQPLTPNEHVDNDFTSPPVYDNATFNDLLKRAELIPLTGQGKEVIINGNDPKDVEYIATLCQRLNGEISLSVDKELKEKLSTNLMDVNALLTEILELISPVHLSAEQKSVLFDLVTLDYQLKR